MIVAKRREDDSYKVTKTSKGTYQSKKSIYTWGKEQVSRYRGAPPELTEELGEAIAKNRDSIRTLREFTGTKHDEYGGNILKMIAAEIKNKYGLGVKDSELPPVVVQPKMRTDAQWNPVYHEIQISPGGFAPGKAGVNVGEEYGHFLRDAYHTNKNPITSKKKVKDRMTHEFFGFLGRRMLYEASPNMRTFFFGGKPPEVEKKGDTLSSLKNLRQKFLQSAKMYQGVKLVYPQQAEEFLEKKIPAYEDALAVRESLLVHSGPYQFASQVDISRIKNWKKLYSMTDEEVRRRFFRKDPDYSGLEEAEGGLEGKVAAAIVLSFIGAMAFLSPNLTGNVVNSSGNIFSNLIGACLFAIGIFGCFFIARRKKA